MAEHFNNCADMSHWRGNWGFDPDVELQVRNAMPPYLLSIEVVTMDPMKISEAVQLPHDSGPPRTDFPKRVDMYMILRNGDLVYPGSFVDGCLSFG